MSKLPSTGPSLLRHIRQQDRQALRQAQSSAFTRSGASVSNPGMLSSDDFDGVDRTHLGTSGWALGSVDGGPSYLALNGRDVVADLAAKDAALTAQQAALTAQQAALAAQLVSINALIGSEIYPDYGYATGDTYPLPAGQSNRITRAIVSISVPAGYTRAIVSASVEDCGINSTAGFDYLNSYVSVSTELQYAPSATVPAGYGGASFVSINRLLTGLVPGVPVVFRSAPYTQIGAWAASISNGTLLSATCLFLR